MVVNYLMQTLGSQRNKMWRPYVVSNKYGKRQAMRDTKLYNSKKKAISAMKKKNDMWMQLNYNNEFAKSSNFEYGAIFVGDKKYKYPKGKEGNKKLLKFHDSVPKGSHRMPDGSIMKDSDMKY